MVSGDMTSPSSVSTAPPFIGWSGAVEAIFARMRARRRPPRLASQKTADCTLFPTAVALERVWPTRLSHEPGVFEAGATWVGAQLRAGGAEGPRSLWDYEISGRFCVLVTDDTTAELRPAMWSVRTRDGALVDGPATLPWFEQLPTSVRTACERHDLRRRPQADGA